MDNDQATLNDQNQEVVTTPEPTMADTMRATLASINERNEAGTEDQATKPDRVRASDGKFAKADDAATTTPAPVVDITAAPAVTIDTAATTAAPTGAIVSPPSSWTAEAKAEFAKASPIMQQEVLRREQKMHDGIAQYKDAANYGQAIHKALQPFENTIRQLGVQPEVAIQTLFNADHKLRYGAPNDQATMVQQLVSSYKIDPAMAIQAIAKLGNIDLSQGMQPPPQVDPNVQHLQGELHSTKQQLNQIITAQQHREESELNSQIEAAKQGKPHFDALRPAMSVLIQAAAQQGQAMTLEQAYEAALWASPAHREELLAKQLADRQAEEARKRAEEAQKAQAAALAAKAASVTNVAKRGTLPAQRAVGSMQDTMRETLEEIRSR